ncbi:hypothetical protein NBRC110019_30090 [Neptunitalea chrysea]|uniref:NmrA-like domain-containing protein n=1 Tax=Neptunitalea chrysea TaxID=1647581 RepID=A0A9W6B9K2_9FLAO|nr:NAD(P)H-binding protein [Neptunitalea chrysea]GLB53968.1 hypothetical protein NBRC110019_30090 [Neptunitalea chrysea]
MNIVLTGSLGNIGKPLTQKLVKKGHSVTVISSKTERQKDIAALGAKAAIGKMEDVDFLSKAFQGADVVYVMATLGNQSFFDPNIDIVEDMTQLGKNYKTAIERAGVKKVIELSAIGADKDSGNGNLIFHYNIENILKQLPTDVSIKVMRPSGFYTNLLRSVQSVKDKGVIISNYGGNQKEPWVSPMDIASAIVEEMESTFEGRTVRYIASDEISPNEIADALGNAIGKPELKWQAITDKQMLDGMLSMGMNPQAAKGLVEMQTAQGDGTLYEDYNQNKPTMGKVKLADFAKEFAKVYNN